MIEHTQNHWPAATAEDDPWIALALRCLGGQATPDDIAQLNTSLLAEPRLQKLYTALALEDQHLRELHVPVRTVSEPAETPRRMPARAWAGLAAAAAIAIAALAWFMAPRPTAAPPQIQPEPQTVAMLSGAESAVFADTDAPMALGRELTPGALTLRSGQAQVMFKSTAMVDLIGPCRFEMIGPNHGRLTVGSIEVFVPEQARGFAISLPDGARVVDLGTRFRVDVDSAGRADVQVLEGRVQVARGDQQVQLAANEYASVSAAEGLVLFPMLVSWNNQRAGDGAMVFDAQLGATQWITQPAVTVGDGLIVPPDAEPDSCHIPGGEIVFISAAEGTVDQTTDLAGAIADQQYVEFAFTVSGLPPGQTLRLDKFAYATRRNKAGEVRRGWDRSRVAVAVNDEEFTDAHGVGQVNRELEFRKVYRHEVDLTAPRMLNNGDTIRIRIYAWGSDASDTSDAAGRPFHSGTRLGDIRVYGRIQTVEPLGAGVHGERAIGLARLDNNHDGSGKILPPAHDQFISSIGLQDIVNEQGD